VGGDRKKGYLRVDDQRMPRLQVKWSQGRADLDKKLAEYAKRLTRGRRGRSSGIEVDTEARFVGSRAKPKKHVRTFAWRGRECGMGVLWNCDVCKRAVLAQVSWLQEERYHDIARDVLLSLEDHGNEGWEPWAIDGFAFLAPQDYELVGWRRLTRYLEMTLQRGAEKIKVARWGMVPLVLNGRSVGDWYRDVNGGRRDVRWWLEEMEIKGHEGAAAWGERRRLAGRLRRRAAELLGRSPAVDFAAVAWHCPQANRLYAVESIYAGEGEALKGVVDSIVCHDGADG